MNQDQVTGLFQEAVGRLQHRAGAWLGNGLLEQRGLALQVSGRLRRELGDAKGLLRRASMAIDGSRAGLRE
jgi:uncharacterized protein YjbJ (UPF0337 family)